MRVTCSTCLETIVSTSDVSSAPCGHVFHTVCLLQWLEIGKNNCPKCRKRCLKRELRRIYIDEGQDSSSTNLTVDSSELEARCDDLSERLRTSNYEKKKALEAQASLEAIVVALRSEQRENEEKLKKFASDAEKLKQEKTKIKLMKREFEKIQQENIELESKLESFETLKAALEEHNDEINHRMHQLGDFSPAGRNLVQIVVLLNKKCSAAAAAKDDKHKQLLACEKERYSLVQQLSHCQQTLKTKALETDRLNSLLREAENEKMTLKEQLRQRLQDLEDIENESESVSTQRTADLRRLVQESPAPLLKKRANVVQTSVLESSRTTFSSSGQEGNDAKREALRECNPLFSNMNILKKSRVPSVSSLSTSFGDDQDSILGFDGMGGRGKSDEFPEPKRLKTSAVNKKNSSLKYQKKAQDSIKSNKGFKKEPKKVNNTMDKFFNFVTP